VRSLFPTGALFLIAGPCVVEDDELNFRVADHLARLAERVPGGIIFKASFDKANRSNAGAARGPGVQEGLAALARVRERSGLPVLTDVHLPEQCDLAAEAVDVLQIPAFLCRQTDLLEAAGATGKPVNVKKGQWMAPEAMRGAVEKVRISALGARRAAGAGLGTRSENNAGRAEPSAEQRVPSAALAEPRTPSPEVALTERGTFLGYGDLVVDMRSFARMRSACEAPVIFDATHSVQQPGKGVGGSSGGAREFIPALTYAAIGAGCDGLFMETHPDPEHAPSDGPNMLPLAQLDRVVERAVALWETMRR
jgi:2-dehydro-3-deoxyphosphooctonate aldolase (KDO 8-P synthase)